MSDSENLVPGIYEQVLSKKLKSHVDKLLSINDKKAFLNKLDKAEASSVLSNYMASILKTCLDIVAEKAKKKDDAGSDDYKLHSQIDFINDLISKIKFPYQEEKNTDEILLDRTGQMLLSIADNDTSFQNNLEAIEAKDLERPDTSILFSDLFTGAKADYQLMSELQKEIKSADEICLLVSFIKYSGFIKIREALNEFTNNHNHKLYVITTSYIGATDLKAIEEISKLPNTKIKISYDTKITRLHAKAYIFKRRSGFSTAYVGSSNISKDAITTGLEWNVKVTQKELPSIYEKMANTFESYWMTPEFEDYDYEKLRKSLEFEKQGSSNKNKVNSFSLNIEIRPFAFQQEILDKLKAERDLHNHYKNLIVAATGTGKTFISAFDYRAFYRNNQNNNKLLFVAHREEILKQSLDAYRIALGDMNFGELLVGKNKAERKDYLFVSIQSLNSKEIYETINPYYYDYIVVDEFHHAAADGYQKLLTYFKPKILLGLTATPERMDGKSVLTYFDNRIAAQIRLPEAIERQLLCPFQYFGVADSIDLDKLKWSRSGYDKKELDNVYTLDELSAIQRVRLIEKSLNQYVNDPQKVRCLGFCVTIHHAEYMAKMFTNLGYKAVALSSNSSDEERKTVADKLRTGEINYIFVVDLFNEGVDIPCIDTIMFLRPTESLTVFLQQLGRGLRKYETKECLTVLDFVGLANKNYNFEEKFSALLSSPKHSVERQIKNGFTAVPAGCFVQLERKAKEHILSNIEKHFTGKSAIVEKLKVFSCESGMPLNLKNFVTYSNIPLEKIYSINKASFKKLCSVANLLENFEEPAEKEVVSALPKLAVLDSLTLINFISSFIGKLKACADVRDLRISLLSKKDKLMLNMFFVTVFKDAIIDFSDPNVIDNLNKLKHSKNMLSEIEELMELKADEVDFSAKPLAVDYECPLEVHCSYSRDQLLVALGFNKPSSMREGVKYLEDIKTDIFMVTLNKSEKDYSPTTMYKDYSINDEEFHWESQSTTSDTCKTAYRYFNHDKTGNTILLFVRENESNLFKATAPYTFLGKAHYVRHSGSNPVTVIWRLEEKIPARFINTTNLLVAN